jgi:outer membrane protein
MKKIRLIVLAIFGLALTSRAQMVFVDTKSILNKMPDYKDSLAKLDQITAIWQKEIDDKQIMLDKMYKDFEKDEPLLSDDMKKKRTDVLFSHQKEVRDLQRQRFGFQGDLFKKRAEMVKPLEDSVYGAVQRVAVKSGYKTVLDKSQGYTVMFSNSKLDITNEVAKEMGIQ